MSPAVIEIKQHGPLNYHEDPEIYWESYLSDVLKYTAWERNSTDRTGLPYDDSERRQYLLKKIKYELRKNGHNKRTEQQLFKMREEKELLESFEKWLGGRGKGFEDLGIILKERDTGKQITKFMIDEALRSKIPAMSYSKLRKLSEGPIVRRHQIFDFSVAGIEHGCKLPNYSAVSPKVRKFIPTEPDSLFVESGPGGWKSFLVTENGEVNLSLAFDFLSRREKLSTEGAGCP